MHSDRSIGLKVLSPARVPRSTRQPLPAVCPSASLPRLPNSKASLSASGPWLGSGGASARTQGRADTIPDKGPGSHGPGGHGAPGHIGPGTVQGTRDHARHPLPLCRSARKPSGPWKMSDRGLECHLALSRNRPLTGARYPSRPVFLAPRLGFADRLPSPGSAPPREANPRRRAKEKGNPSPDCPSLRPLPRQTSGVPRHQVHR